MSKSKRIEQLEARVAALEERHASKPGPPAHAQDVGVRLGLWPGDSIVSLPTSCHCGGSEALYLKRGDTMVSLGCACHHRLLLHTEWWK